MDDKRSCSNSLNSLDDLGNVTENNRELWDDAKMDDPCHTGAHVFINFKGLADSTPRSLIILNNRSNQFLFY